ncbi:uncharacterized protein LOC100898391, partial [Galendromus occidentalis]|uniref:Uncharacterized protein LOC100898391 n=1 Tax=Galendromus occidentalis TaxID=34638 RepID=A0AAJ6VVG9_9ACAR
MEYEEKIFEALAKIEFLRQQYSQPNTASTAPTNAAVTTIKDVIVKQQDKIPKFSGDARKFQEWFELFESAVSTCTSSLEKFKRLKSSLVGNALKQISHLHLKEEFYQTAIDIIRDEYGSVFSAQYAYAADIIINCAAVMILPIILDNLPGSVKDQFLRIHEVSKSDEANKQLEALIKFLGKENKIKSTPSASRFSPSSERPKFRGGATAKAEGFPNSSQKSRDNHSFYGNQEPEGNHSCIFCGLKNHTTFKCKKVLSGEERLDLVQRAGACAKCLRRNHVAAKCRLQTKCKHCKGSHNSLLCGKSDARVTSTLMSATGTGGSENLHLRDQANIASRIQGQANLATGYAYVSVGAGAELRRILLDIGSQKSYITTKLAKALGAKPMDREYLINHTLGGQVSEVQEYRSYEIKLGSKSNPEFSVSVECLGIPVITRTIFPPVEKLEYKLDYADQVDSPKHKNIDILIGTDQIGRIWLNESKSEGLLIALNTRLGWFVFGRKEPPCRITTTLSAFQEQSSESSDKQLSESALAASQDVNLTRDIEFMFQSELLGIEPPSDNEVALENEKYGEIFERGIRRLPSGRYSLKLPFNDRIHTLGDNEKLSRIRLRNLISKSNPEVLRAADIEMQAYVANGYAEEAPPRRKGEFAHYLPIQIVKKAAPENPLGFKVRLVKDAGARSADLASLNDVLIAGPNLLPNILGVLARFRNPPIVIISDIEKAFHQFEIDRSHRTFLRFFWRPGIADNPNAPIKEFWSRRLDFGLVSSPWLHQAGVKHHLEIMRKKRPGEAELIAEILASAYMDDLQIGGMNLVEARKKAKRCEE